MGNRSIHGWMDGWMSLKLFMQTVQDFSRAAKDFFTNMTRRD